jgi:hypothetical protein
MFSCIAAAGDALRMSQAGMPVMTMQWMLLITTMHTFAHTAGCLMQLAASAVAMLSLDSLK